ncbi:cytochrome C [Erwinia typographi]|uniref:Cytochrome c-type protein n=1 Tax=Erwinia typographi TaxID=371042 RepID=A0A0A3ZBG5_9GAMM|nr:NapC/NirT family cytochrome c [Erwinia typographi]KGT95129.1 cytochrome C [Erwinia typographi]
MAFLRKISQLRWLRGWRGWALILLGMLLAMLAIAGSVTVLHKTSDSAFCVSCHSMEKPLAEYMGSIHFQNHAGIRADCADCHIPSQPVAYMATKIGAVKDIFGEITGKIDSEEKYNAHKLSMAESVWKSMKANDSATCRSCHSFEAMDILAQRPDAGKAHPTAIKEGQTCIDCHRGVAHILPDMQASNQAGAAHLAAIAASTPQDASPLYSIATQPFTLQPTAGASAGTLFPSTELIPLKHENGRVQSRLDGWQQEEVPSIIYAAAGKRIISAVLGEQAASAVERHQSAIDSQTGTSWHKVSLTIWLPTSQLIQDRQKIWQYASGLMTSSCTGCHGLIPTDRFTANQWIGVMKGMASRTSLDAEQLRLLTQFAQYHAGDMSAASLATSKGTDDEK